MCEERILLIHTVIQQVIQRLYYTLRLLISAVLADAIREIPLYQMPFKALDLASAVWRQTLADRGDSLSYRRISVIHSGIQAGNTNLILYRIQISWTKCIHITQLARLNRETKTIFQLLK